MAFYTNLFQRQYEWLKKRTVRRRWRKRRFTGSINVFMMAVRVSMTICAECYCQLRQKTNTSSICAILCEVTDEIVFMRCLRNAARRKRLEKFARKRFCSFCTKTHLNIGRWWSKITLPSTKERTWCIRHIPRTSHCPTFSYFCN
jgi:hypothetical protein